MPVQESQIAQDYQGRIVYALLQNADDATSGIDGVADAIIFQLTSVVRASTECEPAV